MHVCKHGAYVPLYPFVIPAKSVRGHLTRNASARRARSTLQSSSDLRMPDTLRPSRLIMYPPRMLPPAPPGTDMIPAIHHVCNQYNASPSRDITPSKVHL